MTRPEQHPASNSTARKRQTDHWTSPDAAVREQIREAQERAWDEGANACYLFERGETHPEPKNPYAAVSS